VKVDGVVVPVEALDKARRYMARRSRFTATNVMGVIVEALHEAGMSGQVDVAYRAADRLLQQERKAGRIVFMSGSWRNVGEA
jgi:hypothetical protein